MRGVYSPSAPLTRRATLLLAMGVVGCGSREPAQAPLPTYGGEQAALFSDLFHPGLFGLDGARLPEREGLLAERTQRADSVVPVRVVTISRETRGAVRNYTVVAQAMADSIRGKPSAATVTLNVADRSPAFAWLEGVGEKWVGTRVLLFLRYYADGPHFYGTVDNPAVRQAVAGVKMTNTPQPQ